MKKLLLLSAAVAVSVGTFAQSVPTTTNKSLSIGSRTTNVELTKNRSNNQFAKSSGVSDTLLRISLANYTQLDTSLYYIQDAAFPADSGAYFGTNVLNANAFGEWYSIPTFGTDTVMKVVGALARWGGTVQPGSTKTINIKLWNVDMTTQTAIAGLPPKNFLIEMPGTEIYATPNININTLKMDTARTWHVFPTAQTFTGGFYLGYSMNYTWPITGNDTLGLYSTRMGFGWDHFTGYVNTTTLDTLIYAQTVRRINNAWVDVLGNDANLNIIPLVVLQGSNIWPSSVPAITKNELSLFGNYPNPATNNTNIKFSLDKTADVMIEIIDITGRTVSTVKESNLSTGEHVISVQTADLAAGTYAYMISTSNGAALAAQFTVAK